MQVRHGEPFKREESLNGSETASVCYRPLKYDVLVYQPEIGEVRINACSKGEKRLCRSLFGTHLFGDEDFFPGDSKYTLELLLTRGEVVLACVDVPGMEWVRLREIHFILGGPANEVEALRDFTGLHVPSPEADNGTVFFPTPAGVTWADVGIRFVDGHSVTVRVGVAGGTYHYAQIGMADGRNARATKQWELLQALARSRGVLTWKSPAAGRKNN